MKTRSVSVILSTYNAEAWLSKTLTGYSIQSFRDFEIVIADDGSGEKTKTLINNFKQKLDVPLIHVWHEDDGFQKSAILNKAIQACTTSYIIMSDGDCIPRKDFVEIHMKYREEGYFLSGGYHKLPMETSLLITEDDILQEKCFQLARLKKRGLGGGFKNCKIEAIGLKSNFLNSLTSTRATWNGHNASGWKKIFWR